MLQYSKAGSAGGQHMDLDSRIEELSGVGKVRAAAFGRLGLFTLRDLLYHFPRAYEYRGGVIPVGTAQHGQTASFILTVATEPRSARIKRTMTLTKLRAFDDSGSAEIVFFNQPYIKDIFHIGGKFRFYGKLMLSKTGRQLASPSYEFCSGGVPLRDYIPVYRLTEGLTRKIMEQTVKRALSETSVKLLDPLPESIRRKNGLCVFEYAMENIHSPQDGEALRRAGRRLMYDELFYYSVSASLIRDRRRSDPPRPCADTDISAFLAVVGFEPTGAQKRVFAQIAADMSSPDKPPMARIVVGDVGCGKTVCAAEAMYIAAKNGMQAALMAPTEILARQHYEDLAPLFASLGMDCELLTGGTKAAEKRRIKDRLAGVSGRLPLVIGTHALLTGDVAFENLGLVITDEQHRFGVMQRAALSEKGKNAHLLVMSATPIPRTLSLVLHGDLDVSRIDEMPPGRQRVETFAVDESYRDRLNAFIRKQVAEGGQVYIVCPTVEAAEDGEESGNEIEADEIFSRRTLLTEDAPVLKAAVDYAAELSHSVFPDIPIGFVHGRMRPADKERAMGDFCAGRTKILVSTTVIEVGVNVPAATLMIVENAERFGLSQLHQLRGRVGRGNRKSYCILVSDSASETARRRLDTIKHVYDGYEIAEQDLRMRGPGDFFASEASARQHGGTGFGIASMCDDDSLVNAAFADARELVRDDPGLSREEHLPLRRHVGELLKADAATMN